MNLEKVRYWLTVAVVVGACLVYVGLGVAFMVSTYGGAYYDCSMAEISPDFPQAVKEACRDQYGRI